MLCALSIASLLAAGAPSGDEPPEAAEERPWSLDLTIDDFGIGIGNSRHVDGLRLNFRDTAPFTVHGVNATVWTPGEGAKGTVDGVALGLPATGASVIRGLALGFGFGADREIDGLGIAILGGGSGGALRGVFAGGLGFGAGGDLDGIAVAGLGIGCGGQARGILVGGLGVGTGGDLRGVALGGLGVGAGGDLRGVALAGLGIGSGGSIEGVAVAGLGVGAPRIRGLAAALAVGGQDIVGLALAPAYFHIEPSGSMTGVSLSAFNRIRGEQRGVAIGIVNYTPSLHGVQIGLINWAGNNPSGLKLLPIANAHFD